MPTYLRLSKSSRPPNDRALTPVVGVLLAIGLLALIIGLGFVLFGALGPPDQSAAPNTSFEIDQHTERVSGASQSSPDPEATVVTIRYEGPDPAHLPVMHVGGDIALKKYTNGEYSNQSAWIVGVDNEHPETSNSVAFPGLNSREDRYLEEPTEHTYAFWVNRRHDNVTTTVDGRDSGFKEEYAYWHPNGTCEVINAGQPRLAYEGPSGADHPSLTDQDQQFTIGGWKGDFGEQRAREDCGMIEGREGATVDPGEGELDFDAMGHLQPGDEVYVHWWPGPEHGIDPATEYARHRIR